MKKIEVQGEGIEVSTNSAELAANVSDRQLETLPLAEQKFTEAARAAVLLMKFLSASDLTGLFCTSRREREFTRRTAGYAKQEV